MDKKEILKEAKDAIDNVNAAKDTLDTYLKRLEVIVKKLEYENLKKEKLTMSDVANIQDKIKVTEVLDEENKDKEETDQEETNQEEDSSELKEDKAKFTKATTDKNIDNKKHGFLVNSLIFLGIIFLSFSLVLSVKKVNPNFRFFNHYIYNYNNTNMEAEIENDSLVIIKKLGRQDIEVGDNVTFKESFDNVKIVKVSEVVDKGLGKYQTKSLSHIFEDEEVLDRSEILGKVDYVIPVLGGIFLTLLNNLWLLYVISGSVLLIAYLINNKNS